MLFLPPPPRNLVCKLYKMEIGLAAGSSRLLPAHLAPAHPRPQAARLQGLRHRPWKLLPRVDGGEPEAELVGKVVARASGPVALDEGGGPKVLEAGAGRGEGLAAPLGPGGGVLKMTNVAPVLKTF